MAPPDFRCLGMWMLSVGGIPIPPVQHGAVRSASIHHHYYEVLTPEERNDPLWDPDNEDQWTTFFMERQNQELVHYEGNGPPPANQNIAARKLWWGVPGRILAFVLDHIAVGNYPRLTMPRRMDAPVSSSSRSSLSTPRTLRAGSIVIGSPPSAPSIRLLCSNKEGSVTSASFARVKKEHDTPAPAS
jgi:hypothetical protein